jgi:hypothetical protein
MRHTVQKIAVLSAIRSYPGIGGGDRARFTGKIQQLDFDSSLTTDGLRDLPTLAT